MARKSPMRNDESGRDHDFVIPPSAAIQPGPGFVSERGVAIDAAAECCEFCIGLRRIDMFQPAG
jgi:hypothetical protein